VVQLAIRQKDAPLAAAENEQLRTGTDRSTFAVQLGAELRRAWDEHQATVTRYETSRREGRLNEVLLAAAFGTPWPERLPELAWSDTAASFDYDAQIARLGATERVLGYVLGSRGAGDSLEIALDRCAQLGAGCGTKAAQGSVLIALTLAPLVLALSKGSAWGWASPATLGSLAVAIFSGFAFVALERRMAVPLLDLALLRNRVLVGATVAILIGAGTINALMYLLSLYFQDPNALGFSPLQAGLATLPATAGLVAIAPFVPKLASRLGGRQVVGAGFLLTTVGFAAIGLVDADWRYGLFLLPLVAVAVGMGLSNGPASSASTACVSVNQVGAASGVSNMARYVGAAVATALAATIYGAVIGDRTAEGQPPGDALASGLAAASWVMAAFSFAGFLMAFVMGRHRAARGTLNDAAAAAAAGTHTLPTSATPVETSSA
jgi:hypothetical protein